MMGWLTSKLGGALSSGTAIAAIVAAAFGGLYKCESQKVERTEMVKQGLERSLAVAQAELDNAAAINRGALRAAELASQELERQKLIAAAEAKKSRQRLDAFNALNRKISNVTENPPVPDAIELVLESVRMRGPVPGASGAPASGADQGGDKGAADPSGHVVPPGTDPAPEATGS